MSAATTVIDAAQKAQNFANQVKFHHKNHKRSITCLNTVMFLRLLKQPASKCLKNHWDLLRYFNS